MVREPITITDPNDPRLDDFRDLTTADRRPDRPGGRGLVIAEGTVVVRRLIASAYPIRAMLGVQRRFDELLADLEGTPAPYFAVSPDLMAEVVGFHLNRGVLATADRVAFPPVADLLDAVTSVAVLEGVGDHENLGAIFRNAAALGVGAVLLGEGCADPLYRRSVRVSMGTVLLVPFAQVLAILAVDRRLPARQGFHPRGPDAAARRDRAEARGSGRPPGGSPVGLGRAGAHRRRAECRGSARPDSDGARGGFAQRGNRRRDRLCRDRYLAMIRPLRPMRQTVGMRLSFPRGAAGGAHSSG